MTLGTLFNSFFSQLVGAGRWPIGNNYHIGYREGVRRKFYKAPGSVAGIHLIFQNYQLLPPFRIFSLTAYQFEERVW